MNVQPEVLVKVAAALAEYNIGWGGPFEELLARNQKVYLDEAQVAIDAYLAAQPAPVPVPNWDEAPDWAQWRAVDEDGTKIWSNMPLHARRGQWQPQMLIGLQIASSPGTPPDDWRTTLQRRPSAGRVA